MVKQRENYKFIVLEPAKSRLAKGVCPGCGKPKNEWTRRKDWSCCSKECTSKFIKQFTHFGWPDLRMKALTRDNFTCNHCGFKAEKEYDVREYNGKEYKLVSKTISSQLIGDHINPIALGGDEWDINNVQTLCKKCDKIKTKGDQKLIAALRRKEKGQEVLQYGKTQHLQ